MTHILPIWMKTTTTTTKQETNKQTKTQSHKKLIYILLGYMVWKTKFNCKKNVKYYWVVICKLYKQVIRYSFVQARMVAINLIFVDFHLCVCCYYKLPEKRE